VKFWNTQVGRWVEGDVSLNPEILTDGAPRMPDAVTAPSI
jgi:hypothetical protein